MENKKENIQKGSAAKIILLLLLSLIMPTLSGAFIGMREITEQSAIYLAQFVSFFAGCLILMFIIRKSSFNYRNIGFRSGRVGKWIIGIIAVEAAALTAGMKRGIDLKTAAVLVVFMVSVGFFEEIIYRGLILQYLNKTNTRKAVVFSSVLFGVGHIANLLGGADLKATIGQIIFAVLFGVVCAEIVILTDSIVIGIVWHSVHNIISQLTSSASAYEFIIAVMQCIILAVLGLVLWHKIK